MRLQTTVDIKNFGDMARDIILRQGKSAEAVVSELTTKTLNSVINKTKLASVKSIVEHYTTKPFLTVDGKTYRVTGMGQSARDRAKGRPPHANLYPGGTWGRINAFIKQRIDIALARRGFAKSTWAEVAAALGLRVRIAAKHMRIPRRERYGSGFKAGTSNSFVVTIKNSSDVVIFNNGRAKLSQSIRGLLSQYRRGIYEQFKRDAARAAAGRGAYVR